MLSVYPRTVLRLRVTAVRCILRQISITRSAEQKVTLVGAAGGIGAPCLMLLKMNSLIKEIHAVDLQKMTPGVGMDVSHMNFPASVQGYVSPEGLKEALCNTDVVVLTAGVPRKPGMTRDDLFTFNADVVKETAEACAEVCPEAYVVVVTNPVNSVVPVFCKIMENSNKFHPGKIFGCTTLDNVRASKFVGELKNVDPREICIPVICGHSGDSIIPLFSQTKARTKIELSDSEVQALTNHVQEAGTNVVKAKAGAGSATLAMAFSAARFTNSLLKALKGEKDIVECAFIRADICGSNYFASPLLLGPCGLEKNLGIPDGLSDFEKKILANGVVSLKKNIAKGEAFVK